MKSPCPLMSAETDRGITFSSLATAPLPPIRLAVGAVGAVRAVGGAFSASKGNAETRNSFAECRNLGSSGNFGRSFGSYWRI